MSTDMVPQFDALEAQAKALTEKLKDEEKQVANLIGVLPGRQVVIDLPADRQTRLVFRNAEIAGKRIDLDLDRRVAALAIRGDEAGLKQLLRDEISPLGRAGEGRWV